MNSKRSPDIRVNLQPGGRGFEIEVRAGPQPKRSKGPPPEISPEVAATLRPASLDPNWPAFLPIPAWDDSKLRAHRSEVYARTTCPTCGMELEPLPKAKKSCPHCHAAIWVRASFDGRRHLLSESDLQPFEAAEAEQRLVLVAAQWEEYHRAEDVRTTELRRTGVLLGNFSPEVVGESFYHRDLAELALALAADGEKAHCFAELVREPSNQYDSNAIRVVIHGRTVGHVNREDASDYQALLKSREERGERSFVQVTLNGGERTSSGGIGPIGVAIWGMCWPDGTEG